MKRASLSVQSAKKSGNCPSQSRSRGRGWRKKETDRKGRRRQLEPLKFVFFFIWGLSSPSHMSIGSRVHSHCRVVSNQIRRWFLKLFFEPDFGSHAQFWCARSLSCPPKELSKVFPESFLFFLNSPFLLHFKKEKNKQKEKLMSCFKYIYICIQVHVHFHSGQKDDLLQQNLVFIALVANVH